MKKTVLLSIPFLSFLTCFGQEDQTDTLPSLEDVTVRAFDQGRKKNSSSLSIKIVEINNGDRLNKTSLVNGFNTIAGVRMEERSPGSYRINIRGSSLRSPFGVRNVKVYWNDIPMTDPGGNTYFNQFAWNNFSYIEVFKGPAGSMYGAGTGGLLLLYNLDRWQPGVQIEYVTGSYGLHNIFTSARFGKKENKNQFTWAHNENDGYRDQSALRRDNFSWLSQLKLSDKLELSASLLFTDMYYQTPGGLTLSEFNSNPKAARPAAGSFPSAVNARAAIDQKNITAGFTNTYRFNTKFKNLTTLYAAFNQVKNPAIRNYERRKEPSFGGRTVFTYLQQWEEKSYWQLTGGSEAQAGWFNTLVSKNRNGNPDTVQTNDDINYTTYNVFLQGDVVFKESWIINAGLSLNKTSVEFSRLSSFPVTVQKRTYQNELAPRISIRKNAGDYFHLKGTVSRGFSPPTIGELLPSTGVISTDLEAEYGWNYELTVHSELFHRKLVLELTGFYFKLNKGLVQRRDLSGADFFVNAGNIRQKGLEATADYFGTCKKGFVDYYALKAAFTYNHFCYGDFVRGTEDFSGNTVPSVPAHSFSLLADLQFKKGFYSNATFYSASRIYLNDANTASAAAYHVLGWRIGWRINFKKEKSFNSYRFNCYAGADNLLDETYSLGNDINAAAGRYYNAAPRRNYYAGISLQRNKTPAKK